VDYILAETGTMENGKTRVTVDFTPEAYAALTEISKALSTSKAEALRKSLGLMRFVLEETQRKHAKLILEGPKRGERREIVQF
jgi:hypothetical protein